MRDSTCCQPQALFWIAVVTGCCAIVAILGAVPCVLDVYSFVAKLIATAFASYHILRTLVSAAAHTTVLIFPRGCSRRHLPVSPRKLRQARRQESSLHELPPGDDGNELPPGDDKNGSEAREVAVAMED